MRIPLFFAILALPASASATDWDIPPDAVTCQDSADAAVTECVARAYEAADAELNAVWKKVLADIDTTADVPADQVQAWKADLVAAQEAWDAFKDKDCNGARSFEYWGGSARSLAVVSCLYEYTVARTEDLKARYLSRQ